MPCPDWPILLQVAGPRHFVPILVATGSDSDMALAQAGSQAGSLPRRLSPNLKSKDLSIQYFHLWVGSRDRFPTDAEVLGAVPCVEEKACLH